MAGLVLGAALAFIRHHFDVRVRTQHDVEEHTGHAVLGVVPETNDLKKQRAAGSIGTMGHAGESLRQLRTNLRFINVDHPPKAVVITSASPGEGKSTIATNLAQVIAKSGRDVVLVDCDLRKPVQAKAFGVDTAVGLTQVLAGDISLREAVVATQVPRLWLLPAGSIPPNPSELLGSRRMQEVIEQLTREAFVLLDAPPMLLVTDAGLLSEASDGALLVGAVGQTTKAELALCAKQLGQVGAALLGTVLNKAPRKGLGDVLYGYGAGGYGNRRYGAYAATTGAKSVKRGNPAMLSEEVPVELGSPRARRGVVHTSATVAAAHEPSAEG
ncbi:CpsD/CapB family tyrosine-protein kinase [Tessaracoccus sp. G1721]